MKSFYTPIRQRQTALLAATAVLFAANGLCANYPAEVLSDGPQAYYRLNDPVKSNKVFNSGSLGSAGNGTNLTVHPTGGALASDSNPSAFYNGTGARTMVPFQSALNPAAASSFTIEAWFNVAQEVTDSPGPCPLFNRVSSGDRQGWVFFQRSPATGWNFRMYSGSGSTVGVDVTGQAPTPGAGTAGTWSHVVVVWDGSAATATMYVNGENVGSASGTYLANTANNAPSLTVGSYDTGSNSFNGAVDEVALYAKTLSAEQILAHFKCGTNAAPAVAYKNLVLADSPVEYLRLDEPTPVADMAINLGSLAAVGEGTNSATVLHPVAGALAGSLDTAARYRSGANTKVAFNSALNPVETESFTVEAWFNVAEEVTDSPGPCPLFNRVSSGDRQGWVFFQRSPATGWNFRMYSGSGSTVGVDVTGQASTPGAGTAGTWSHVVVVWDGPAATATLYINGENVGSASGVYLANADPNAPTLTLGSYDNGNNPFNGSVDEVALYAAALPGETVLAHYQNGTNSLREVPYPALIQADRPVEYLRLGEPAYNPAINQGALSAAATGVYMNATNNASGPRPSAFAGFESDNAALNEDGVSSFLHLGKPAGLNFSGKITLESWIKPNAIQPSTNAILIAHGPDSTSGAEVALALVDNSIYSVGTWDGLEMHGITYPAPPEDLTSDKWIHLAGTYDGAKWNLFRNGALVASATDSVGAVTLTGDWTIGAHAYGVSGVFSGILDEPAIYSQALGLDRIQAHYKAGLGAIQQPVLKISRGSSGNITLEYVSGTLESTDTLSATPVWTVVPSASAPSHTLTPKAAGSVFYRVRVP